jgi:hypothetical protein
MPAINASSSSAPVTRNIGKININAPVLIKKGGSIIFFAFVGLSAAFIRTTNMKEAIKIATSVEAITNEILPLL